MVAERKSRSDTIKDLWKTPYRERVTSSLKGRSFRMPDGYGVKNSERQGGIKNKAFPLALRGGLVGEIVQITDLDKQQIRSLFGHLRKTGELKRPVKEEISKRKSKDSLSRKWRNSKDGMNAFALAKGLWKAGFFTEDLSVFLEIQQNYKAYDRKFPDNFPGQLRLEAFYVGRRHMSKGKMNIIATYRIIGSKVDLEWFDSSLTEEEEFIVSALGSKYSEDKRGFFRIDKNGDKWRPIDMQDGKMVVFDSKELARREK